MNKKIWSYNHKISSKIGLYVASHLGLRHPQNYYRKRLRERFFHLQLSAKKNSSNIATYPKVTQKYLFYLARQLPAGHQSSAFFVAIFLRKRLHFLHSSPNSVTSADKQSATAPCREPRCNADARAQEKARALRKKHKGGQ